MICQFFDRGIQSLGGEHSTYAQDHHTPFPAIDTEQESGRNHSHRCSEMKLGVVLMTEQPLDSRPGVAKGTPASYPETDIPGRPA